MVVNIWRLSMVSAITVVIPSDTDIWEIYYVINTPGKQLFYRKSYSNQTTREIFFITNCLKLIRWEIISLVINKSEKSTKCTLLLLFLVVSGFLFTFYFMLLFSLKKNRRDLRFSTKLTVNYLDTFIQQYLNNGSTEIKCFNTKINSNTLHLY